MNTAGWILGIFIILCIVGLIGWAFSSKYSSSDNLVKVFVGMFLVGLIGALITASIGKIST